MQNRVSRFFMILCLILLLFSAACLKNKEEGQTDQPLSSPSPDTILQTDKNPPVLHAEDWETPQPLPAPIDAEGNELSPFITLAGDELYYFYTPDLSVSEAKQALDGISGTYYSKKVDGVWSEPQKLLLSTGDTLDGCIYTDGQTLWFCSRRDGNYEDVDFYTAVWVDGAWRDIRNAGEQLNVTDDVGDMHLSADQNTMIFSAFRTGGFGLTDLWQTQRVGESWSEPENLGDAINGTDVETYPFLSEDGLELWFTSPSRSGYPGFAIFRSIWQDGAWGEPQEIISNDVSEVSIDRAGNLYFAHLFFDNDGKILGSKIYVAQKK
ncbi:MAG: hypothetical protein GYA52_05350 [Chloroflexi bacterium]|nr:hypothetical protein [Chloroflexota bacterium]